MMPLQRACDAESQVRNKLSNGPRRVQRKCIYKVFCNVEAYVSCQGYDGILIKSTESREFKVAPRIMIYSSLTELQLLSGAFSFMRKLK
jgi:hypothetical protein